MSDAADRFQPPAAALADPQDAELRLGAGARSTRAIHRVLGILYGVLALVVAGILGIDASHGAASVASVLIILLVIGIPASLHLLVAWGASRGAAWARVGSCIFAALMVFGFPIGTLIAWRLFKAASGDWEPRRLPTDRFPDLRGA